MVIPMYVYFIQAQVTRLIKIGQTRGNVYDRLATIQGNSPDKLKLLKAIETEDDFERSLHIKFGSVRSHNEWFYPSRGLITFIESLNGIETKRKTKRKIKYKPNPNSIAQKRKMERIRISNEMYMQGTPIVEILKKLGITRTTVEGYLTKEAKQQREKIFIERNNLINEMYMQGMPRKEIMEELGVSAATVNNYLPKTAPQQRKETLIRRACELRTDGLSYWKISRKLDISVQTVKRYLEQRDVK